MTSISKKKINYSIGERLRNYLHAYDRETKLPVTYKDLLRISGAYPLVDSKGRDTLWETVFYEPSTLMELSDGLTQVYALLKTDGDLSFTVHLIADRIDYCRFGNSNPFRVRIVNQLNDNYDYFYVKRADASRVYGLELEHLLSPNNINYLVSGETLIEEHIAGIPGDDFIRDHLQRPHLNQVRIAKEFVKFNERCFARLLGDMRAYNYIINVTPDFEDEQYRVRAIDFDQQSYEGKKTMYLPQFFKDNRAVVLLCSKLLKAETIRQYQTEERTLMARRARSERYRLKDLIDCMRADDISPAEKTEQLKAELNEHHHTQEFNRCRSMGDVVRLNLRLMLARPRPQ
ncbi:MULTISPECIES: hypothetical protein [Hymenobacter]|uniref:Uncharacterized protein n=1 Tax=Hymenobacter jejuensis TaxID=2502781 RepID=A0A5B7ZVF8_9BACT|nr:MULTISPECIES: hypothetical protein [Hymenobacter]MBC6988441.1 hypothetical protein [Hymenobacter sp. BT491]QDA59204.1 hypothetical protein FHG12_03375 [Hymenobacter jejuensis]